MRTSRTPRRTRHHGQTTFPPAEEDVVIRLATAPLSISTFPGGWMLEIGGMLLFRLRNKGAVTDAKHVLRAENGCWVGGHESAWILLDAPREVGPKKVASPPKLTLLE